MTKHKNDPHDDQKDTNEEYAGNIWGWKFSFISLGIIVVMLLLMLYRYSVVNNSPPVNDDQRIIYDKDSSELKSQSVD